MKCIDCGAEIPVERLEILPDTETCVKCSTVTPVKEFLDKATLVIDVDEL